MSLHKHKKRMTNVLGDDKNMNLVLLNFAKAFDPDNHRMISLKIQVTSLHLNAFDCILNFLSNNSGVLQGSVIEPI